MIRPIVMLVVLTGFSCVAGWAQEFYDPFNLNPGTTIPGYTEHRGDWQATGTAVQSQASVTFQELVNNTYTDLDACAEIVAIYDTKSPNLLYTGPILRYNGAGSTASFFMVKVQDNVTPRNGWDTYFTYFHAGGSWKSFGINGSINPPVMKARVRLQVIDGPTDVQVQVYIDTDMDGKWDITRTATTPNGHQTPGKMGINGYRNAIADDLKFFNATLYLQGTPKIGTTVTLPGRGTPKYGYIGACSFGNSGFGIGAGKSIPLSLEPLFFLTLSNILPSIFQSFQGRTDTQGDFTMSLAIPQVPGLVGITIWASAVTISPTGIAEVAPDTEITFTQ